MATPDRRQGRDVSATPLPLRPNHPASRVRGGPCSSVVFGLQGLIWGQTTGGTGTLPWRWDPRKRRIIQLWRSSLMSGVDKCLIGLFLRIFFFLCSYRSLEIWGVVGKAPCLLKCQHFLRPKRRLVRIVRFSRPSYCDSLRILHQWRRQLALVPQARMETSHPETGNRPLARECTKYPGRH